MTTAIPAQVPVIWLDGLDVPIVNLFDASFRESFPGETQPNTVPEGDSHARYGGQHAAGGLGIRPALVADLQLSVFAQPRDAGAPASTRVAPRCHGVKMRFINPATGGAPMPTIGAFMQLLPKGFRALRIARLTRRCTRLLKDTAARASVTSLTNGGRATSSSCRRGHGLHTRPPRRRCCSAFRTGPHRRRLGSGASSSDRAIELVHTSRFSVLGSCSEFGSGSSA